MKYLKARKYILSVIIFTAIFLRLYNIYSQPPKLADEMSWIWSGRLTYLPSAFSLMYANLPLYNFSLFIMNWIFFSFGCFLGVFHTAASFDTMRITNLWLLLFMGRLVSAIFGTATVFIVYLIGKKIKNEETGLVGALFLAFVFSHIEQSRYIHYLAPVIFFMALSFLFCLSILDSGKLKYYLLAGFFIGYGGAVKYTSFFGILPLMLAHLLRLKKGKESLERPNIKNILLGFIFIILGFILGYPLVLSEPFSLIKNLEHYRLALFVGWPPGIRPKTNCWIEYLPVIYEGAGPYLLVIFIFGLLYCLLRREKKDILLASYPIIFYICLGSLHNLTPNYATPLSPFIALIGAYFLVNLISYLFPRKFKNITLLAIAVICIIPSGIKVFRSDFYKRIENKEEIAKEFIARYIPKDKNILKSNQELSDNLPIMMKIADAYYSPHFKAPMMDTYKGKSIRICGRVIFEDYKGESIKVSLRSKDYYPAGPPDIALITLSKPGEYEISAPVDFGQAAIRASAWLSDAAKRTRYASAELIVNIGNSDIRNMDLIIKKNRDNAKGQE